MTVWIYVENAKQVGDRDHLKVFSSQDAAQNGPRNPERAAFEYAVQTNCSENRLVGT